MRALHVWIVFCMILFLFLLLCLYWLEGSLFYMLLNWLKWFICKSQIFSYFAFCSFFIFDIFKVRRKTAKEKSKIIHKIKCLKTKNIILHIAIDDSQNASKKKRVWEVTNFLANSKWFICCLLEKKRMEWLKNYLKKKKSMEVKIN